MTRMVAAIIISFGCYLPVTPLSKKNAQGGPTDDPKNLRLHLDHRYGAAAAVPRRLRRVCSSMSQKRYSIIYSSVTGKQRNSASSRAVPLFMEI